MLGKLEDQVYYEEKHQDSTLFKAIKQAKIVPSHSICMHSTLMQLWIQNCTTVRAINIRNTYLSAKKFHAQNGIIRKYGHAHKKRNNLRSTAQNLCDPSLTFFHRNRIHKFTFLQQERDFGPEKCRREHNQIQSERARK